MAAKTLYAVDAVVHTEDDQHPIRVSEFYVLARTPSQVSSKMMKSLGDKLIFIERMSIVGSSDLDVVKNGTCISELVG